MKRSQPIIASIEATRACAPANNLAAKKSIGSARKQKSGAEKCKAARARIEVIYEAAIGYFNALADNFWRRIYRDAQK